MSFAVGVYGYTFTQAFDVAGLSINPLYEDIRSASDKGRDTRNYHLTGLIKVPIDSHLKVQSWSNLFFDLEAAFTFIEQQRVVLAHLVELRPSEDPIRLLRSGDDHELKQEFPLTLGLVNDLTNRNARSTPGECLRFDAFDPDMRLRFLQLVIPRLSDQAFLDSSGFRAAFFRNVEMIKLDNAPIDVSYSLLFTGLELLARKYLKPGPTDLGQTIKKFLEPLGFSIDTNEANQIAACRNGLFHRGEYGGEYQHDGEHTKRRIELNQLPRLDSLFTDVLLKISGFHDPHINWNRWRDRMAFQ